MLDEEFVVLLPAWVENLILLYSDNNLELQELLTKFSTDIFLYECERAEDGTTSKID